jgi:hypothetical protein
LVIPLAGFQAYSSSVCSLLCIWFSGSSPGPCLSGSLSLHLICLCGASSVFPSLPFWLLLVCVLVKNPSIVVCAGLVGQPLSCSLCWWSGCLPCLCLVSCQSSIKCCWSLVYVFACCAFCQFSCSCVCCVVLCSSVSVRSLHESGFNVG